MTTLGRLAAWPALSPAVSSQCLLPALYPLGRRTTSIPRHAAHGSRGQTRHQPAAANQQPTLKWHTRRSSEDARKVTDRSDGFGSASRRTPDVQQHTTDHSNGLPAISKTAPSPLVKAMFGNIRNQNADQLQHLVENHISVMDAPVLAAVLVRMTKLKLPTPVKQYLLDTVWGHLKPRVDDCKTHDLALTLWAAAKLQLRDPAAYRLCLRRFLRHLDAAPARHISNVMYAVAAAPADILEVAAQHSTSQTHMDQVQKWLLPAFMEAVHQGAANPQDVSNTLWALATLQLQPSSHDMRAMLSIMQAQLDSAAPQSISNTLWALAKFKHHRPSLQLLADLLARLVEQSRYASAQDASCALWALATMQLPPAMQQRCEGKARQELQQTVLQLLRAVAAPAKGYSSVRSLSNALWAAVKLEVHVPLALVQQVVSDIHGGLRYAGGPQDISNLLWALASIHARQQQQQQRQQREKVEEQQGMAQQEDQQQEQCEQQQQAQAAQQGMGRQPQWQQQLLLQQEQLDDFLAALAAAGTAAKPQALSNTLWAAAKLGLAVPKPLLGTLVDVFLSMLQYATCQEASNTLWALATLQQQLGQQQQPLQQGQGQQQQQQQQHSIQAARRGQRTRRSPQQQQQQQQGSRVQQPAVLLNPSDPAVVQQLVAHVAQQLEYAGSQEVSNTLWAVAKLGQQVSNQQLHDMVCHLIHKLPNVQTQELVSTLWATATMRQLAPFQQQLSMQLPLAQVQELLAVLGGSPECMQSLSPQHLANTLWAVARLTPSVMPAAMLQQQQGQAVILARVPEFTLPGLCCVAYALGQLGVVEAEGLLLAVLKRGLQLAHTASSSGSSSIGSGKGSSSGSSSSNVQDVEWFEAENVDVCRAMAIMCWSAAVLGLQQQHTALMQQLASAYAQQWHLATPKDMCQVYMLHLWLLDQQQQQEQQQVQGSQHQQSEWQQADQQQQQQQLGGMRRRKTAQATADAGLASSGSNSSGSSSGSSTNHSQETLPAGLGSCLTQQQLQQCRSAWLQQLEEGRSVEASWLQKDVFAAAQQLPGLKGPPVLEALSPDGLLSIDITAETSAGARLAIEVDGPSHFRLPDRCLTGTTLFRNRALAARGFVVVSVPHFGWQDSGEGAGEYLVRLVHEAVAAAPAVTAVAAAVVPGSVVATAKPASAPASSAAAAAAAAVVPGAAAAVVPGALAATEGEEATAVVMAVVANRRRATKGTAASRRKPAAVAAVLASSATVTGRHQHQPQQPGSQEGQAGGQDLLMPTALLLDGDSDPAAAVAAAAAAAAPAAAPAGRRRRRGQHSAQHQ